MKSIIETILAHNEISESKILQILSCSCPKGIDYSDVYFEYSSSESWSIEDGIVKNGTSIIDSGVGIRSISGEKTGFAYSNTFGLDNLLSAAKMSRSIASFGKEQPFSIRDKVNFKKLYSSSSPLEKVSDTVKVEFLKKIDSYIRKKDNLVDQVIVNLAASHTSMLVVNSDGMRAQDDRPLVRFNVMVILKKDKRRERGSAGGGGRFHYDEIFADEFSNKFADEAIRQARVNLDAVEAKAGMTTVVLGPGWPGVLLHEAIGHGLEGDFNRKKTSAYSNLIGQKVASSNCTIVDDGTISSRRGSLSVDDEGSPTEETVLIENGILKGYMQDKLNAKLMKTKSTGNGRRESYAHLPMPRMTNTFMMAGPDDPEEIISSVKNGIYAVNFSGGQVDITNGQFVFTASEAYLIENSKITSPIKGMTLIGNGPEILKKVSMIGNDLKLDDGVGTCGKDGQSVPVGVGQPTLKIDEITVGGTKV